MELRQDTFRLSDEELNHASLYFSSLETVHTVEGTWQASFEADGNKTSQATFRKKLNPDLADPEFNMRLKELVVTPLQIRILLDNEFHKFPAKPWVQYHKTELLLNGQTVAGGLWQTEKSGSFFRFEAPEWYKDWSRVPMKLQLSDAVISKRSTDQWFPLEVGSESKRSVEADLDGFPVTLTYYRQDQDLIVESQSDDPKFPGISQTAVKLDGKALYPQPNHIPPGGTGSNKRTDRYPGLLSKQRYASIKSGLLQLLGSRP